MELLIGYNYSQFELNDSFFYSIRMLSPIFLHENITLSHQNQGTDAIELSALDSDDCRYESWWLLLILVLKSENI